MTTVVYGIKNCDIIKKALKWLDTNNVTYTFHDYRKDGLSAPLLEQLMSAADPQLMLNKRSTSFRALSEQQKENLDDAALASLFLATPTLIKRPLLVSNAKTLLGFKTDQYQSFFKL